MRNKANLKARDHGSEAVPSSAMAGGARRVNARQATDKGDHFRAGTGTSIRESEPLRYLKEAEAASLLGVSVKSLQAWRYSAQGPKYSVFGRRAIRYRLATLLEWAAAQEVRGR